MHYCKHGIAPDQCYTCKTGPVGYADNEDIAEDKQARLNLLKERWLKLKEGKMSEVKTMVCNKCGIEKKLDSANFVPHQSCKCGFERICRQCKKERQKELYHLKRNAGVRVQAKPALSEALPMTTQAVPGIGKISPAAAPSCLLDLSGEISAYPEIFSDLKKIAAQEMRTIEAQAVYMLRKAVGFRLKALDAKLNLMD